MATRRPVLLLYSVLLLLPLNLCFADENEIDILIHRGQEHQNKAFQSGAEEQKRHLRRAIEEYEKIFYLAPEKDGAYILAGSCYEHLGEFQKAAVTYALGAKRVALPDKKVMLLSNVARVNTNLKNMEGVVNAIKQMEYIDPRAIEIAAASRDVAMDSSDDRLRARYAEKCLRICDYHLKNGKNADIRKLASNLKQGLENYWNQGAPGGGAAERSEQNSVNWESILADVRRGQYRKLSSTIRTSWQSARVLTPSAKAM